MKRKVIVTLLTVFTVTAASLTGCGKKQQEQIESQIAAMMESSEFEASEASKEPKVTEAPKATATPEPEATATPDVTAKPEMTEKPETTDKPDVTASPETTKKPESTKAPESTAKPEATKAPESTAKPEATKAPEATKKPEATKAPATTPKPEATPVPVSETTPAPAAETPAATPAPSAEHQHTFAWDWTWTEWGKTCDDPTITYKADVCSECGYKQNVRVVDSHLEHAGPINEINDGERTCTTGCTTTHICTACGEVTKSYTSSPLGHSMDEITGNCRRTGCDYHEHRWADCGTYRFCYRCDLVEYYSTPESEPAPSEPNPAPSETESQPTIEEPAPSAESEVPPATE